MVDATLHVADLNISYGNSIDGGGGAIAAIGSNLTVDRTNFIGNRALGNGGAVYASGGSSVYRRGGVFADKTAYCGGAMHVSGYSLTLSWNADTFFNNNSAINGGGALHIDGSILSWSGGINSVFDGNRAIFGGVIYAIDGSNVSCSEETSSTFSSNMTAFGGGAIMLDNWSNAFLAGNASFDGNTATGIPGKNCEWVRWGHRRGGFIGRSGWTCVFQRNTAEKVAGALYADNAIVCWSGKTSFIRNIAQSLTGSALLIWNKSNVS